MREFNVTGSCNAKENYMVDISNKLDEIIKLVNKKKYFTINRARQYGKTTTIRYLVERLKSEYIVLNTSFEGIGEAVFKDEKYFNENFIGKLAVLLDRQEAPKELISALRDNSDKLSSVDALGDKITTLCEAAPKPVVLIIDEVDKSCNHKLFFDFLGMLRAKYLTRDITPTFHSVILAGVHDIKTIRYSGSNQNSKNNNFDDNARKQDSPWNIAAKFDVDMSFNPKEISTMLIEYEKDHNTGMDIMAISNEIYNYTSGYPFLVSRICQAIDEELGKNWSLYGVQDAVKIILNEENTLFDDMFKNFENSVELYELIYNLLIVGEEKNFATDNPTVKFAKTFGIIENNEGKISIANEIFAIRIYNYFISKNETKPIRISNILRYEVVIGNKFDMEMVLKKFREHYATIYSETDEKFLERQCRLIFLTYLKPLINGAGFYHIESETLDFRRMDIVLDYGKEQFIIELKLWRGDSEHQKAYEQLVGYLESKNAKKGYLLTFDFRKNKEQKIAWESFGGKEIFDVVV